MSIVPHNGEPFDATVAVAVIGAGAAGLVAALAAREAGAEVVVLERDAVPSGSTALSAGLIPAASTSWQALAGIEDGPARFAADIMAKAHHAADPALVHTVTEAAGPALEWLHGYGLAFSVITDFRYPGHSVCRMHSLPSRSGTELVDALRSAAEAAGVEILCQAHATALVVDGDTVRGVECSRPDGTRERVGCGALVLACSGYGGNPGLVQAHVPQLAGAVYFGHAGNQGDALLWGQALGAATRDLSGHQGHGSVAHPAGILITWATVTEGGIQVNAEGRRFSDESRGYSEQAVPVLRQPGMTAWTVFDERVAGITRQFEDFRRAEAMGVIVAANDLAARMHVPEAALHDTLAEVSGLKQRGGTDGFGRDFTGQPDLTPPYRAVRVTGALFHTQGGLVVDHAARVRRACGGTLPNLFAAGGAACGVSGPSADGYLSGNGLLTAITLGRIAGAHAAGLSLMG